MLAEGVNLSQSRGDAVFKNHGVIFGWSKRRRPLPIYPFECSGFHNQDSFAIVSALFIKCLLILKFVLFVFSNTGFRALIRFFSLASRKMPMVPVIFIPKAFASLRPFALSVIRRAQIRIARAPPSTVSRRRREGAGGHDPGV